MRTAGSLLAPANFSLTLQQQAKLRTRIIALDLIPEASVGLVAPLAQQQQITTTGGAIPSTTPLDDVTLASEMQHGYTERDVAAVLVGRNVVL